MDKRVYDRFRSWIGTMNNPDQNPQEFLAELHDKAKAKYTCGQLERGELAGTIHIQFFMYFNSQMYLGGMKKIHKAVHWEPVRVDNGASEYCMKEDTRVEGPWEFGTKPRTKKSKDLDWDVVRQSAQAGDWESINSSAYIRYYGNLKKIGAESRLAYTHESCRGYWLWGAPGTGKTTFAREEYGEDIFIKSQSKWWDGYIGQKIVILDDLDSDCLAHYLKIWADKWSCTGEIKGGTVQLQHTHFIVTSNYSIEQLFGTKGTVVIEAISRRFKVTEFKKFDM